MKENEYKICLDLHTLNLHTLNLISDFGWGWSFEPMLQIKTKKENSLHERELGVFTDKNS